MFRPTRPSSGALKLEGTVCTFRATTIRVVILAVFVKRVQIVPVTCIVFFGGGGILVAYRVCSVDVINT
jgi:hypothetical protein